MNTNFTKDPIVGTSLTPSVIKKIHTAVRRYMPIAGNGIRTSVSAGGTIISAIPAPAPKKQKDKPLPFEVRYDGTLDSGAGGWKIYLPTEHLVQFDGAYLDPLNDVTPILDSNGDETGWYSFDEITLHDDHVWLVISESSGAYTASFESAEDQQAVANICIAEVSYEEATQSTPETITIKQSVVGALVVSAPGEAVTNGCFALIKVETPSETPGEEPTLTAHFINRYYNYGNVTIECDDVTVTPQEGGLIVALKVPTDGSTIDPPALIATYADLPEMQADQKDLRYCVVPLYHLSESFSILCDFRFMPTALVGENLMYQ